MAAFRNDPRGIAVAHVQPPGPDERASRRLPSPERVMDRIDLGLILGAVSVLLAIGVTPAVVLAVTVAALTAMAVR